MTTAKENPGYTKFPDHLTDHDENVNHGDYGYSNTSDEFYFDNATTIQYWDTFLSLNTSRGVVVEASPTNSLNSTTVAYELLSVPREQYDISWFNGDNEISTESSILSNETISDVAEITHEQLYTVIPTTAEYILLLTYLICVMLWSIVSNLRIFYLIVKKESYHVPYFYIIAFYTIVDVVQVLSTVPMMLAGIILNRNYNLIPSWFCTICGVLSPAMVFVSFHILGLMAIERYYFFVRPLMYPLKFTPKLTMVLINSIWIVAVIFSMLIDILAPKQFYVTIIHCQTPSAMIFTMVQILLYLSPAFICTAFSLVKLFILQSSHQARVADAASTSSDAFQRSAKKFKKSKGAAIKIIVLTSGTFWITFLPGGVFRMIVFSRGVTWDNLDSFDNPGLSYIFRYLNVFLFTLSSALNPLIYMYTHKPLQKHFLNKKNVVVLMDASEEISNAN